MAAVFTQDGAIGMLLRRVQPFLRERGRATSGLTSFQRLLLVLAQYAPPGEVEVPERGGPRGMSVTPPDGRFRSFQTRRAGLDVFLSPTTSVARKVRGVDPTSDAVDLLSLVDQPLAQMQLDRFFAAAAAETVEELEVEGTWSARRIASGAREHGCVGSVEVCPSKWVNTPRNAHRRATLARLRADVRGAVEAAKGGSGGGGNSTTTTKDRFVHAHLRHLSPADAAW